MTAAARKPKPAKPAKPAAPGALTIEYVPTGALQPYGRNARSHSNAQIKQIAASITEFGFTNPILIAEDREIIAGHGRLLAAIRLGLPEVPAISLFGLSAPQRRALRLADNQLALNASWDDALLREELTGLSIEGFDLGLIGFADDDLKDLLETVGGSADPSAGTLLELVNITIAEPSIALARGDHYLLAGRHHLIVASVIEDHEIWARYLGEGVLFAPYPGAFVPFGSKAADHILLMVQPDPYIAGHILDRYVEIHGASAIAKVAA